MLRSGEMWKFLLLFLLCNQLIADSVCLAETMVVKRGYVIQLYIFETFICNYIRLNAWQAQLISI